MSDEPVKLQVGERVARICTECKTRVFGDPDWSCPTHPRKTVDQPNMPWRGVSTEPATRGQPAKKGRAKKR